MNRVTQLCRPRLWLSFPDCMSPANPHLFRNKSTKSLLDYSKVPVLNEEEIIENFIKGGGPGGSNLNKTVSCVSLKHKPTGIIVKCQHSRLLHQNRELARQSMVQKLDDHFNGEMSVKAQILRLEQKGSTENSRRRRNLSELKRKYKEHVEGGSSSSGSPSET